MAEHDIDRFKRDLIAKGLSFEHASIATGLAAEYGMQAYNQGYSRGYNAGYADATEKATRPVQSKLHIDRGVN
jgi:flagellar biosynthesis/type III secretory pathway protein FliH